MDPATTVLPGRNAVTTGLSGIVCAGSGHRGTPRAECSHDGTQRDCLCGIRPPRESPGGMHPRRDNKLCSCSSRSGRCGHRRTIRCCRSPTPTEPWPTAGPAASLAAGAATSRAAASLVFMRCRSLLVRAVCVCVVAFRARTSRRLSRPSLFAL